MTHETLVDLAVAGYRWEHVDADALPAWTCVALATLATLIRVGVPLDEAVTQASRALSAAMRRLELTP
jgi:hypothetical protein